MNKYGFSLFVLILSVSALHANAPEQVDHLQFLDEKSKVRQRCEQADIGNDEKCKQSCQELRDAIAKYRDVLAKEVFDTMDKIEKIGIPAAIGISMGFIDIVADTCRTGQEWHKELDHFRSLVGIVTKQAEEQRKSEFQRR